jgi:hypothetical protein
MAAHPVVRERKDGPLISPASFRELHRLNINVIALSLLVLDCDHDAVWGKDFEVWKRYRFFAYTSHSHLRKTKENPLAEPRFRIVIAIDSPILADKFPLLWHWAALESGGKIDEAVKDLSRMYYLPAKASQDAPYDFYVNEGEPLDWQVAIDSLPPDIVRQISEDGKKRKRAEKVQAETPPVTGEDDEDSEPITDEVLLWFVSQSKDRIANEKPGQQHWRRLKEGTLCGGLIPHLLSYGQVRKVLAEGVQQTALDFHKAMKDIDYGLCKGQALPFRLEEIEFSYNRAHPDGAAVGIDDFYAHSPSHKYIYVPTREMWSATSVNSRVPPVLTGVKTKAGDDEYISASQWLDKKRAVEQMSWMPGEPLIIQDKLIAEGGWFTHRGARCFNLYQPPILKPGNPADVDTWTNHIVRIYPEGWLHILAWLAHRVQRPQEKINHALVLGGSQGIGKDTLLEPVKWAVGPWNFIEVGPHHLLGRFNGFTRSVILRISEARDLGDVDRYGFYERMKVYTAAPPDVLRVDEKNLREYSIPNLCGVIITTNYMDGLYLPSDDRRYYVAWSDTTKGDFDPDYWTGIHTWLEAGGKWNVAAYLARFDLSEFNPKAPPPHSAGWRMMVDAGQAPECAEISDLIDSLGEPDALTLQDLIQEAHTNNGNGLHEWLTDRKNRRTIPYRLEEAGYIRVRNDTRKDGLWIMDNERQVIYAKRQLTISERLKAARELV